MIIYNIKVPKITRIYLINQKFSYEVRNPVTFNIWNLQ